jgi:hypothetical protein
MEAQGEARSGANVPTRCRRWSDSVGRSACHRLGKSGLKYELRPLFFSLFFSYSPFLSPQLLVNSNLFDIIQ